MAKDKEWSGLLKLPSEVIISELRVKLGQQEAYIAELEDRLKGQEIKAVKQSKLEHLEKENKRLDTIIKDLENRLGDYGKAYRRLENDLLKFLKEKNG